MLAPAHVNRSMGGCACLRQNDAISPTGLTVAAVLSCPMLSSSSCKLGTAAEASASLPLLVVAWSVAVLT